MIVDRMKQPVKIPVRIVELSGDDIRDVIKDCGGPTAICDLLLYNSPSTISNWAARGYIPPQSQIVLQVMFPDVFKKIERRRKRFEKSRQLK